MRGWWEVAGNGNAAISILHQQSKMHNYDLRMELHMSKPNTFYIEAIQKVLASEVIAKAVIKEKMGISTQYALIVVFANSSTRQFYWVLRVDGQNTPASQGKVIYSRDRAGHVYHDLRTFIEAYLRGMPGRELVKIEIGNSLRMEAMLRAQNLPSDIFEAKDNKDLAGSTRMVNRTFVRQAYGR